MRMLLQVTGLVILLASWAQLSAGENSVAGSSIPPMKGIPQGGRLYPPIKVRAGFNQGISRQSADALFWLHSMPGCLSHFSLFHDPITQ